ncbi:SMAD/FHA domain-containing protein [Peniophora sp. CONT]|nr:SMAD/FHA domain-containing protein [Peniophora sp. CONT]
MAEPDSPHPPHQQQRGTILGSFLRARPRGISTSASSPPPPEHGAPPMPASPTPHSPIGDGNRRPSQPPATAPAGATSGSFSQMLRRRRSGGNLVTTAANGNGQVQNAGSLPLPAPSTSLPAPSALRASPGPAATGTAEAGAPAHRLRLVPHIDSRRSLRFDAITRNVREGDQPLRIGRFTDRSGMGVSAANALGSNKLAFKSKVVSRAHAEIWCEGGGKFFIKDTKSSSGTFLNHVRLSAAAADSRPFELRDGDTLQLGVDYQGGNEDIYKCVRMRVEIGREWQMGANAFNTAAFKQLRAFSQPVKSGNDANAGKKVAHAKSGFPDCCICLFSVTIQQALFIAPCSHAFHYKCIRPLLEAHHPAFACPLCRTFADLEEDVEVDGASIALSANDGADSDPGPGAVLAVPVPVLSTAITAAAVSEEALDTRSNPSSQDHGGIAGYGSGSEMALDGGRLGAETDVERDGPGTAVPGGRWGGGNGGGNGRLPPMPMSGGGGDSDEDAEMGDVQFEEAAEDLAPATDGVDRLRMRSRSGSPSVDGSGGSGSGAAVVSGVGVGVGGTNGEERGAKRKR